MTPEQERQFIKDFVEKGKARNPNVKAPPQKTRGFNSLDLDPQLSRWDAMYQAIKRFGTPVR
jgi:hypothetical protein